jgi:hypothetical protein
MIDIDRKYIIMLTSEINLVDFSEVVEDENQLLKRSKDNLKMLLKWDYEGSPSFLQNLSYYEGPFNNEQIFEILHEPDWR